MDRYNFFQKLLFNFFVQVTRGGDRISNYYQYYRGKRELSKNSCSIFKWKSLYLAKSLNFSNQCLYFNKIYISLDEKLPKHQSLHLLTLWQRLNSFIQIFCRSMVLENINLESSNRSYSCQCFPKMRHKRSCSS